MAKSEHCPDCGMFMPQQGLHKCYVTGFYVLTGDDDPGSDEEDEAMTDALDILRRTVEPLRG